MFCTKKIIIQHYVFGTGIEQECNEEKQKRLSINKILIKWKNKDNELNARRKDKIDSNFGKGYKGMSLGSTSNNFCITFDILNISSNKKSFIESLPYPFSLLDLQEAKSSTGKCWLFHMSSKGVMQGYLFPGGYRLYGLKEDVHNNGAFFIECRNNQKNNIGVLSAMINKTDTVGSQYGRLTLTNGIIFCTKSKKFLMNYHCWKEGKNFMKFQQEKK